MLKSFILKKLWMLIITLLLLGLIPNALFSQTTGYKFFFIINGSHRVYDRNYFQFYDNMKKSFNMLTQQYGYTSYYVTSIFSQTTPSMLEFWENGQSVLRSPFLDNDSYRDVKYNSTYDIIDYLFTEKYQPLMTSNDLLYLQYIGHGGILEDGNPDSGVVELLGEDPSTFSLTEQMLKSYLDGIIDEVTGQSPYMIIIWEACKSGSFLQGNNGIQGPRRFVFTATEWNQIGGIGEITNDWNRIMTGEENGDFNNDGIVTLYEGYMYAGGRWNKPYFSDSSEGFDMAKYFTLNGKIEGEPNLIYNGTFDHSNIETLFWEVYNKNGAYSYIYKTNNMLKTSISNAGSYSNSILVVQDSIEIQQNATYMIAFHAKASNNRNIKLQVVNKNTGASYSGLKTAYLGTSLNTYCYYFTMTSPTDLFARLQFEVGGSTRSVYLDNVTIEKE